MGKRQAAGENGTAGFGASLLRLIQGGRIGEPSRSERNYLRAYRLVLAVAGVALTFTAYELEWLRFENLHYVRALALVYLIATLALIHNGVRDWLAPSSELVLGLMLDIAALSIGMMLTRGVETVLPLLLLVSLAGAAHYLPFRLAMGAAAAAVIGMLAALIPREITMNLGHITTNGAAIGVVCFAVAALASLVGRRVRKAEALAERRGADLVDLDRLNDLVVQRMRTGVLVLDREGGVQRMNESAWRMLGSPKRTEASGVGSSPVLKGAWRVWRKSQDQPRTPVALVRGGAAVLPRFSRLFAERDDLTVVFLDDATLLNQRAEALTLDTLGRLSASIAHELRNPLAAIQQAGQLLAESSEVPDRDKRLVEIIGKHSQRLERIVRGVLDLARRERASPETIELQSWLTRFVEEFRITRLPDTDELTLVSPGRPCDIVFDPVQLEQVVGNLLNNTMNHGRRGDAQLRITVTMTGREGNRPLELRVADNGKGIPPDRVDQLFRPFQTTSIHGTGLGLYLCRQLCEANGASLDLDTSAEFGACFVIRFQRKALVNTLRDL